MEVSEIGGKETFRKANLSKQTNFIIKCTNIHSNENWNNLKIVAEMTMSTRPLPNKEFPWWVCDASERMGREVAVIQQSWLTDLSST